MSLPPIIGIEPLAQPVGASVVVPGSKSITNRALVLAALGEGETELWGALWSEDTQVMVECLRAMGFEVRVTPDVQEPSNRTIRVRGRGGVIPEGGTASQPRDLFVGNAGTAARFLVALTVLGQGYYRLSGVPRMHERPQAGLFRALRQLGYELEAVGDHLPVVVRGAGPRPGHCSVEIHESSQFASALLLAARTGGWKVEVHGEDTEEMPYVRMTERLVADFGRGGGRYGIEPDASSGSYFVGADALQRLTFGKRAPRIEVSDWPVSGWQIDAEFPRFALGPCNGAPGEERRFTVSRARDLGDSIMTAIVLAPFWSQASSFTDLGRLRVQECERVRALRQELTKCGADIREAGDALFIRPTDLHGAEIETYDDHRMAMCFATLALRVRGMSLRNPACVRKTFPNFFQKLAAPPPAGLGVRIVDAQSRHVLTGDELSAEA